MLEGRGAGAVMWALYLGVFLLQRLTLSVLCL